MTMIICAGSGESFYKAAERAILSAEITSTKHVLIFNEVEINVYPESYSEDLYEKYYFKCKIRQLENN